MIRTYDDLLTVVITPDALICTVIGSSKTGGFVIKSQASMAVENNIYNGTPLKKMPLITFLRDYIATYKLEKNQLALCLANGALEEEFVRMPTMQADATCLHKSKKSYAYQYIAPDQEGNFIFCCSSIRAELLFSYQLLCAQLPTPLVRISSPISTSLAVYHRAYGTAYRQTQLALDLQHCNYSIERLLDNETLHRLVGSPFTVDQTHKQALFYALGLKISEQEHS